MEGSLKKKSMIVVWSANDHIVVLPKVFKYITRWFYIQGDALMYTKNSKERLQGHKGKLLVRLDKIAALHVFPDKMEVVDDQGKHFVLKSRKSDIKLWVPAIASRLQPSLDQIVPGAPPVVIRAPAPDGGATQVPLPLAVTIPENTNTSKTPPRTPPARSPPVAVPGTGSVVFDLPTRSHSRENSQHLVREASVIIRDGSVFPLASIGDQPPTPPYPHPMLRKLPSFRSPSALSFTLTSKQSISWLNGYYDDPNKTPVYNNYGTPGSPVNELGWEEWDKIFDKCQRNEEIC